jgi:hypothetical protein
MLSYLQYRYHLIPSILCAGASIDATSWHTIQIATVYRRRRQGAGMWKWIVLIIVVALVAVLTIAYGLYRQAAAEAEAAMVDIKSRAKPALQTFEAAMISGLPEIAQRYFRHAIMPGSGLGLIAQLEMQGTFLLGDKGQSQNFEMQARQILAPPSEFVWIPEMRSGLSTITGSDALVSGAAWTRFWINGLFPVVNQRTSPDLVRSALTRSAMEAIWVPASLLPENGVTWEQTGPNTARLSFNTGVEPVDITLDADGRMTEIVTMRWSDANPEKKFRLQPFGGTIEAEARFGGFTIPSDIKVGNHYGTDAYFSFFQARITSAEYL